VQTFPRVSILMIFLDEERFIEEAIRSVLEQTFDGWELLLIDDGSTDASADMARRYAAKYPERILYLEHPGRANLGMSASRNLGLRHTRGEYIALLDADDVYLPDKLSEQVELLDADPSAAMLYGRTCYWFGWTGDPSDRARDHLTLAAPEYHRLYEPPELLELYIRDMRYFPCTCSVLIRHTAVESVGGFVDGFRGTYEDMAFYAKIFLRYRVRVVDRCWDRYRQHPDSCWAEVMRAGRYTQHGRAAVRHDLLEWLQHHLEEEGLSRTAVGRLIRWKLLLHRYPVLYSAARVADRLRASRAQVDGASGEAQ